MFEMEGYALMYKWELKMRRYGRGLHEPPEGVGRVGRGW